MGFKRAGAVAFALIIGIGACSPAEIDAASPDVYREVRGRVVNAPVSQGALMLPQEQRVLIHLDQLSVQDDLSFRSKVERHAEILEMLTVAIRQAQSNKALATNNDSLRDYIAAQEDENNALHFLTPYAIAQAQAEQLGQAGMKLASWEGRVCNGGQCTDIDPMIALFMILAGLVTDEFNGENPFGSNNDLLRFLQRPAGGPNSELVRIREFVLQNDNGEIARLIRDPVRRPLEIVQDVRDEIIAPGDNGEIARAIRDPIKCTVGHLWGGCG